MFWNGAGQLDLGTFGCGRRVYRFGRSKLTAAEEMKLVKEQSDHSFHSKYCTGKYTIPGFDAQLGQKSPQGWLGSVSYWKVNTTVSPLAPKERCLRGAHFSRCMPNCLAGLEHHRTQGPLPGHRRLGPLSALLVLEAAIDCCAPS